jgi:hypothetical protein
MPHRPFSRNFDDEANPVGSQAFRIELMIDMAAIGKTRSIRQISLFQK